MIRVLHLIDDANLGGINRTLDAQQAAMPADIMTERQVVDPQGAPPGDIAADIVVIHFTLAWRKLPFLLRLRRRLGRRKLIIVEHSYTAAYEQRCVPHPWRFRLMLRLGFALADKVVAVSHGQAGWLRDAGLVGAGKLLVIEPTSDITPFTTVPPLAPREGPLRLGCYGRYAPQKGLFLLLEAMRALPAGVATLTLAGYGPEEAALTAAASDLAHVRIGGPTARPESFVAAMDALVMPSLWEAFGTVCAEARAAGRPVLVADIDGLSEQVPAALRVAGPTAAALVERITWLAKQDLRAIGESLRAGVAGFSERHAAAWVGLLREAAAHGR